MYTVAVIGCGVIGLPAALAIQDELGPQVKVTIFTNTLSPETTGDVAAGLWTPYLVQNTPQEKVVAWSKETQDYILKLWRQGYAKEAGISLQLIMEMTTDPNYQIPDWVNITLGHSVLTQKVLDEYSRRLGKRFCKGFTFVSFVWEASKFLPFLQQKFLTNGGDIRMAHIKNLEDLKDFDLIVNCTGLAARELVPDDLVQPIRGQIVRVYAPWQFHTAVINIDGEDNYIIPNHECVILGGTHQTGNFSIEINEMDKRFILDGCGRYAPALGFAPVIRHQAGLRPGRDAVRLETEFRDIGGERGTLKIIHNYGHGGSGITLSIGCAKEAARLARDVLQAPRTKL